MTPVPLPRLVGAHLRRLRDDAGATQRQVAAAVARRGLAWNLGHISRAERGLWSPDLTQLLVLAAALDSLPGRTEPVTVADLVAADGAGDDVTVALAGTATVSAAAVAAMLRGEPAGSLLPERDEELPAVPARGGRRDYAAVDRRVAADLGMDAETMLTASRARWGRSLSAERADRIARAEQRRGAALSPAEKAAITAELRGALSADRR